MFKCRYFWKTILKVSSVRLLLVQEGFHTILTPFLSSFFFCLFLFLHFRTSSLTWCGGRPIGFHQLLLGQIFFVLLAAVVLLSHHWVVKGSLTDGAEAVRVVSSGALSFFGLSIQLLHLSRLRYGWDRNKERTLLEHAHFHQRFVCRTIQRLLKYKARCNQITKSGHTRTRWLQAEAF